MSLADKRTITQKLNSITMQTTPDQDGEIQGDVVINIKPWPYLCAFLIPVPAIVGSYLGGLWYFFCPFCVFVFFPFVELIVGNDNYNPSSEEEKILESDMRFRIITWCWSFVQLFMTLWGCYLAQYGNLTLIEYIGLTISVAICTGGIGITVSHELIHKDSSFEQTLGKFNLMLCCYMHFYIEHLWGHHKRVATKHDPATARLGESFYRFLPRTVLGGFLSAWDLELQRLRRKGFHLLGWHNQIIWFICLPLLFGLSVCYVLGVHAMAFFFIQSWFGFSLLEAVNYLEHYGLERKAIDEDEQKYERVSPVHSWSADHKYTNYFIFKLQRHADHHAWPARRYQILRNFDFSPKLPAGYTGMISIALIPPLWHYIMDKRVEKLYEMIEMEERENDIQEGKSKSKRD